VSKNAAPTAKERLTTLEEQVSNLHQSNVALATILENQRLSIVELSDKLDTVIFLSERETPISEEAIKIRREANSIEMMKADISDALAKGALTKAEVVGNRSFIVVQEKDKEGKVVQSRAQVALMNMPDEIKNDFIGLNRGAIVEKEEISIELQEIYDIAEVSPEVEG